MKHVHNMTFLSSKAMMIAQLSCLIKPYASFNVVSTPKALIQVKNA